MSARWYKGRGESHISPLSPLALSFPLTTDFGNMPSSELRHYEPGLDRDRPLSMAMDTPGASVPSDRALPRDLGLFTDKVATSQRLNSKYRAELHAFKMVCI